MISDWRLAIGDWFACGEYLTGISMQTNKFPFVGGPTNHRVIGGIGGFGFFKSWFCFGDWCLFFVQRIFDMALQYKKINLHLRGDRQYMG